MPLNSSATVYGGAGGRGAKASVSTPEGLRNMMLRNNPDVAPESAPLTRSDPRTASPAPPADPLKDHKSTLRGLNDRLSSYLDKVRELEEENSDLQQKIDDIWNKRKTPEGRNWDEAQKPLDDLEKKIKDLTLENANQLLLIDNNRLANEDFKNKLDDETKAKKEMEKDLEKMKNLISNIKLEKDNLQTEMKLVKDEIDHLKNEHKKEVDDLLQQIRDSDVQVEVDSSNSNLATIISSIRAQYQKMSERNLKETEDWYNDKFENIKEEEAQNTGALDEKVTELKKLLKEKKTLEVLIRSQYNTMATLEETLNKTKWENNQRLAPLYRAITKLEANLREVRSQVERQVEINKDLLTVKMKLEKEIEKYRDLIGNITAENESSMLDLEDGLQSAKPNPDLHKGELEETSGQGKKQTGVKKSSPTEEVVVCSGNQGKKTLGAGSRKSK